ncbi:Cysteine synthase [compost metagenome]
MDGFICAVGSGGTLAGTAAYLRERQPTVRIGLADVPGAALYSWFTEGVLKGEGSSIAEGIGVNRITGNLEGLTVDHAYRIEDAEFLPILFDLVREEGLSLGPSSGVNIAGAIRMARDLGPGHTIATVLCDPGQRYASKIYDPGFLAARGLPCPDWMGR